MDVEKVVLEEHMNYILKGNKIMQKSYKEYLFRAYNFLHSNKHPCIGIDEQNFCIRLQLKDSCSSTNLNKLFFIFEIGEIFPQVKWRNLIKRDLSLTPVVLHKRASFLPVYSFSFDRIFTAVYWGEKQAILDPSSLKYLRLKNFLFTILSPSKNVYISMANFAWLKSVERIWCNNVDSTLKLSKKYIFNALYPPDLTNKFVWYESPFIIIGDRQLDIFTLHKTVCYLDPKQVKTSGNHYLKLKVNILDNTLNSKLCYCLLPKENSHLIENKSLTEAVIIKRIRIYDEYTQKHPSFQILLYPLNSSALFDDEYSNIVITIASIVLRRKYLESSEPLSLEATLEKIKREMVDVFHSPFFKQHKLNWDTIAFRLLQKWEGIKIILESLGVYQIINNVLFYLHPSLIESLLTLYGFDHLFKLKENELKMHITQALKIAIWINKCQGKGKDLMEIKDIIRNKLNLSINDSSVLMHFNRSLKLAQRGVIPISKFFSLPKNSVHWDECDEHNK
ncbi:MAG: hypothetical protein QXX41_13170 [Nitrososphaerota archaeon]